MHAGTQNNTTLFIYVSDLFGLVLTEIASISMRTTELKHDGTFYQTWRIFFESQTEQLGCMQKEFIVQYTRRVTLLHAGT